jgi:hypothetical protein
MDMPLQTKVGVQTKTRSERLAPNASNFARTLSLSLLALGGTPHAADAASYRSPQYRGYNLDWCYIFENECGKPAADAFCRLNGQANAIRWEKAINPGYRTMTIGQNSVCDPAAHVCDSFVVIECQDTSTGNNSGTYVNPMYNGYRLDWCRIFENECGAPAADAFCKAQGFNGVGAFKFQPKPGVATMTVGQNSVCDPQWHGCDSFEFVRCR